MTQLSRPARVLTTDPDFRREPKTNRFCALCQKDLPLTHRWAFYVCDGFAVVHPEDTDRYVGGDGQMVWGWQPIGNDCAKKFPPDWTLETLP